MAAGPCPGNTAAVEHLAAKLLGRPDQSLGALVSDVRAHLGVTDTVWANE
jgi:hypothetical protein